MFIYVYIEGNKKQQNTYETINTHHICTLYTYVYTYTNTCACASV